MNNKYNSLNSHIKSISTDYSFLVKTSYSTKASSTNLLDFRTNNHPKQITPSPSTVTTTYHKRHFSRQYNSVIPSPRIFEPNLTPAQRKLHEQGNSYSHKLKYNNSLGYISRLDKEKQEQSVLYNDKVSNKHNEPLIKAKEKESKEYKNISKHKKINNLHSDIFNYLIYSNNVCKPIYQQLNINMNDNSSHKRKNSVIKYNKISNANTMKSKRYQSSCQQLSRLAMEVEQKYSEQQNKTKKYLNLTSSLDNYSLFAPNDIKLLSYNIKTPNPHNDEVHIKKMFANGGVHVYDVQDRTMGLNKKDSLYNVKIRIDPNNKLSQKSIETIKKKFLSNGALMKKNKALW